MDERRRRELAVMSVSGLVGGGREEDARLRDESLRERRGED